MFKQIASDSVLNGAGKIIDRRALDWWFVADRVYRGAKDGPGVAIADLIVNNTPTVSAAPSCPELTLGKESHGVAPS